MVSEDQGFSEHRSHLIGVGYRMLGSVVDAEDVVQETYLRWHSAGRPELEAPRAWFTRVATRLCLDRLKSAQSRRESFPGESLPEPWVDAEARADIDDSISMALLIAVESLTPKERAAFVLHDVFGYSFDDVAETLALTAPNCRQLAARARRHLQSRQPKFAVNPEEVDRLTTSFIQAMRSGDVDQLRALLAADVELSADGGGRVPAVAHPVVGRDKVARFLWALYCRESRPNFEARRTWFNGSPALIMFAAGHTPSAMQIAVAADCVQRIFVQRDPEELTRLDTGSSPTP